MKTYADNKSIPNTIDHSLLPETKQNQEGPCGPSDILCVYACHKGTLPLELYKLAIKTGILVYECRILIS